MSCTVLRCFTATALAHGAALLAGLCYGAPSLQYASYFGGKGSDAIVKIAVDPAGNIYIAGITDSTDLRVTQTAFQAKAGGGQDGFVAKFDPSGSRLIYCTYLGGSNRDQLNDLTVDAQGNAYVTGYSMSPDFPTTPGAYRTTSPGGAFVAKLNPGGTTLVYATFIDGVSAQAYGIAIDRLGNAYVTGTTFSSEFPTTPGAFQRIAKSNDAFVTKLDGAGSRLLYSTLLGGSGNEEASSIAIDSSGNAYVAGGGKSTDFPVTSGAFQRTKGAGATEDGFVAKLNADGGSLIYASYLGGSGPDGVFDIAIDDAGNAYMTGITYSTDFPITGLALQHSNAGDADGFVSRLNPSGTALTYSTYLGGPRGEQGLRLAVNSSGDVFVTGPGGLGFPVTGDALQRLPNGSTDAFVVHLSADGASLKFATFLGGGDNDAGTAIAVDASGMVYVAGNTFTSADFPATSDAFQKAPASAAGQDGFFAKVADPFAVASPLVTVSAASYARDLPVAPDSIASGFGEKLAPTVEVATELPLPSSLGGVSVKVRDGTGMEFAAPLFLVSPGQINFLVPPQCRPGPGTIAVFNQDKPVAAGSVLISNVAPSLFSANSDGKGVAATLALKVDAAGRQSLVPVFSCGTAPGSCVATPIDLGAPDEQVILLLYGSGIRGRAALDMVNVQIGGLVGEVQYAGAQSEYPGLDQVNVKMPRTLVGRGRAEVILTVAGRSSNVVEVTLK